MCVEPARYVVAHSTGIEYDTPPTRKPLPCIQLKANRLKFSVIQFVISVTFFDIFVNLFPAPEARRKK